MDWSDMEKVELCLDVENELPLNFVCMKRMMRMMKMVRMMEVSRMEKEHDSFDGDNYEVDIYHNDAVDGDDSFDESGLEPDSYAP